MINVGDSRLGIEERFDYIIAGAGAAGLSLVYHLHQAGLTDKRILLLDRAPKTANDRTWCFWEVGEGTFEPVVFRRWERLAFHGEDFSTVLEIAPYRYKMIRGGDFYRFMAQWLDAQPNIARAYAEVTGVETEGNEAVVRTNDGRAYHGAWAFNSILLDPLAQRPTYHYLLQHFLGWVIWTPACAFDPNVATLMDFRVDQADDTRFVYVLPFDAHTALVEYTVFSRELLPRSDYVRQLEAYINDRLRITDYETQHEEFGVIPMTDAPFPARRGARVINIGTAGGCTKPSTGYTFQRIQRRAQRIAQALKATGRPDVATPPLHKRYQLFDSALLNVLDEGRERGRRVFTDLFARNPPQRVFRFLDEDTTPTEDVQIMSSVNIPAFVAATADALRRRLAAPRSHPLSHTDSSTR
ncbi:MAG: lycopene cyclase family protein [Anaerolineae bacterium]|nr:lycopene cyclase family protein [Candidatus Roseilinea sp.]MDW8449915.1 lycopene cyclase family protein [Anaerolineae bacterium]